MSLQFGVNETLDLCYYDFLTGEPLLYIDYCNNFDIDVKATRVDLRGGRGNYQLMGFDHTKLVTCKSKLPLVDLNMLSALAGKQLTTGTAVQAPKHEILYASAAKTITLAEIPIAGTLKIYLLKGTRDFGAVQIVGAPATVPNTYSIAEKVVTLNATTAPLGTGFHCIYEYMSSTTASKVTVTASDFPKYMRITGEGLVVDQVNGLQYPVVFDVKKAKIQSNFAYTLDATKPTELDLTYDLYAVNINNVLTYFDTILLA